MRPPGWTPLALAAALLFLAAADGRAQAPRSSVIEGAVTDTLGYPIVGATVREPDARRIARTDSLGRFRLPDLRAGRVSLLVQRTGYVAATFRLALPPDTVLRVAVQLSRDRCIDHRYRADPASLANGPVLRRCEVDREADRVFGADSAIAFAYAPGVCYQADLLFVVDSVGGVEAEGAKIVWQTNSRFSEAALAAALGWRYRPALKNGRPVRQLVLERVLVMHRPSAVSWRYHACR